MGRLVFGFLLGVLVLRAEPASPMPVVTSGRIERIGEFRSRFVPARNIDVWLPPGYNGVKRCPVIYMQDGQMLFDARITWNRKAWDIADSAAALIREKKIPETIVVGIWSIGSMRMREYFPEKALEYAPRAARERFVQLEMGGPPQADSYLRFIVEELKPAIDSRYATLPDLPHSMVMGSSLGGMISLYAVCEYPQVFGGAGCLSTHWLGTFERNATFPLAMFNYLQAHLPSPADHRIYFDRGTATLDALYSEAQAFADVIFREGGYGESNFRSRVFPGDDHSETSWARRVAQPLMFLDGIPAPIANTP